MKATKSFWTGALATLLCMPLLANATEEGGLADEGEINPGEVSRATFTTDVVDREPMDQVQNLDEGAPAVAYFTELSGMEGHTVIHRWEYEGEVMSEVAFDVDGPRWRVHSTKQLDPSWTGEWVVKVVDADGNVLSEDALQVGAMAIASEQEPEAAPPAAPAP